MVEVHLQEPQWYTSMPSLLKHQSTLWGRNGEEIKDVKNSFTMLGGVRKDGQLEAAERSPVIVRMPHQHSQAQLNVVSEVTDEHI